MRLLVGFAALLVSVSACLAENRSHFDYLDLAYSKQNTDWHNFGDSDTATLKGSVSFLDVAHLRGRYNGGNVQLPARGAQQDSWTALGLGLHFAVSSEVSVYLGSDHNELELQNNLPTERGWYHHVGVRYSPNAQWQLALEAGESDVIFRDTTFTVEGIYRFHPALGVSTTLRDYDDLDLTEYEIGLRWFFRQ